MFLNLKGRPILKKNAEFFLWCPKVETGVICQKM